MTIEVFNRIEKKYLLDETTFEKLVKQLEEYMEADEYNKNREYYSICNIYYDTPSDELIRNSLERPAYKEKLRLRSYGVPKLEDLVFLEIKKKFGGIVNKRRTAFLLKDAYTYMETKKIPEKKPYMNPQILQELDTFLNRYQLVPKVYLAYDRKAFFGREDPAFRVTFDTNLRSRRQQLKLEEGSQGVPLLEEGIWLMEIKIAEAVPLWFTHLLSEYEIYPTTFSKYGTEYKKYLLYHNQLKGEEVLCLNQLLHRQEKHHYQLVQQY